MRQGQQNHNNKNRMRGRNRKGGPNPLTRTYESNGGDVKIRGTALHVAEKYVQLARDAQASGDRVASENYLQHAEHYYRIVAAAQAQMPQQQQPVYRPEEEGEEDDGDFRPDNRFQPNPQPQYGGGNYNQQNYGNQGGGQQPNQNFGGNRHAGQGGGHAVYGGEAHGNAPQVNGNGHATAVLPQAQDESAEAAPAAIGEAQEQRGDQPRGERANFRGRRRRPYRENQERGEGRGPEGDAAPVAVAESVAEE